MSEVYRGLEPTITCLIVRYTNHLRTASIQHAVMERVKL